MTTQVEDGKTPRFDLQTSHPNDSTGSTVTSGASNTYGSWVEILADIGSIDKYLNDLVISMAIAGSVMTQIEIGIGAGGSEIVIASGHIRFVSTDTHILGKINLGKVRIPSGSRLAIHVRDGASTQDYLFFISLLS